MHSFALNASSTPSSSWITDSEASHHMIGISSLFSYHVYSVRDKVRIDNGSYSSIVGKGDIITSPSMQLSFVFHVLNFSLNLLFIIHITKSLNYNVTFLLSHCVIQGL